MTPVGGGPAGPPGTGSRGGTESIWLRPGDVLIRQGELGRDLYVLLSGELSIVSGDQEIARVFGQGEVIGELGALTGRPRTATVKARSAAEVLQVRHVKPMGLERLPKVLATIEAAIARRYHIVYNKNLLYRSSTGMLRRILLQDAMCSAFSASRSGVTPRPGLAGHRPADESAGIQRQQVRKRLDERLAMFADADDPMVLDRIAGEYGVQEAYRERLATRPWLNDDLVRRLGEVDNAWRLTDALTGVAAATAKAECVVEATEILHQYEAMPGIRREMDVLRMEALVPLKAKIEALKTCYLGRVPADLENENTRTVLERQVKLAVEGVKADAGSDVVLVCRAARHLGVEAAYEEQIRNLVAMSETGTHFVDVAGSLPCEDAMTRP